MDILKNWSNIEEDGFDCLRYEKVTFKDEFFIMLKRLIDETNGGKLYLFKKEMTSYEVIELIKRAESQQLSETSECHVLVYNDSIGFAIDIYDSFKDEYDRETHMYRIISDPERIHIRLNLTEPSRPFVYLRC